ncbi:MAG TPA: DUF2917 domain-containing protein [Ramlibacter sp.]|uniref:DUF2917 domain-containing protein n=1 Tax=Ramlibacter sp. TaxID=1917967 RepID=UPI002D4F6122|nr:DUF2917 domain-containing protein [Ramlibacter sp.]HZY18865.1 DUF2917 domain-containing protein [Ramlibacter sp.]
MNPLAAFAPSCCAVHVPGAWKLEPGRAVTLRPREEALLRVMQGRIWVTFDGPHAGALNDLGDRVVGAGETFHAPAGRRIVLEPMDSGVPAWFNWEFAPEALPVATTARQGVRQSWRELRLALGLAGGAAARLAGGLVRAAAGAVLPRPAAARRAPG